MHLYLRAVGLSKIKTKTELKSLVNNILEDGADKKFIETDRNSVLVEYSKLFSDSLGVTIRGEYDSEENLTLDFYYPYLDNDCVSTTEDVSFERHAEKESFAGVCEDYRIGVSMIFYLQNEVDYMKYSVRDGDKSQKTSICFSALSIGGTIMLPIKKNAREKEKIKKAALSRNKLLDAAKRGDEEAIENLTLNDIDTYTMISKKILKEDVFTLVDSYFMPYGVECDQYSLLGEIEEINEEINSFSGEAVYVMMINCNGMNIRVCINKDDLLGEPAVGRRFKGTVWLQGKILFGE